jgi:hypothetical protein
MSTEIAKVNVEMLFLHMGSSVMMVTSKTMMDAAVHARFKLTQLASTILCLVTVFGTII